MNDDLDLKQIGSLTATDSEQKTHAFSEAWSDGPAVVVFLRHFGCIFCREQAAEFKKYEAELKRDGINLIYVSTGSPRAAHSFKQKLGLTAPVWVDPERNLYQAFHFHRGLLALLKPATLINAVRAWKNGFRQHQTRGDPWQNGGVLVARADGTIAYLFRSKGPGDKPETSDVIAFAHREAAGKSAAA